MFSFVFGSTKIFLWLWLSISEPRNERSRIQFLFSEVMAITPLEVVDIAAKGLVYKSNQSLLTRGHRRFDDHAQCLGASYHLEWRYLPVWRLHSRASFHSPRFPCICKLLRTCSWRSTRLLRGLLHLSPLQHMFPRQLRWSTGLSGKAISILFSRVQLIDLHRNREAGI